MPQRRLRKNKNRRRGSRKHNLSVPKRRTSSTSSWSSKLLTVLPIASLGALAAYLFSSREDCKKKLNMSQEEIQRRDATIGELNERFARNTEADAEFMENMNRTWEILNSSNTSSNFNEESYLPSNFTLRRPPEADLTPRSRLSNIQRTNPSNLETLRELREKVEKLEASF